MTGDYFYVGFISAFDTGPINVKGGCGRSFSERLTVVRCPKWRCLRKTSVEKPRLRGKRREPVLIVNYDRAALIARRRLPASPDPRRLAAQPRDEPEAPGLFTTARLGTRPTYENCASACLTLQTARVCVVAVYI